jgi:hypothetical protein
MAGRRPATMPPLEPGRRHIMARDLGLLSVLFAVGLAMFAGCGKDEASPEKAEETLTKIAEHVAAQDFDKAEELLKKLEANKDEYAEALQKKIAEARKNLDKAKKMKIEVPELPGT